MEVIMTNKNLRKVKETKSDEVGDSLNISTAVATIITFLLELINSEKSFTFSLATENLRLNNY